jgi:ubiquitin-conjugating enzyme E2 D/E
MSQENSLDRIKKELSEVRKSEALASIGASAGPIKRGDLYHWKACFIGPKKTGYDGGLFRLLIDFPNNFPQGKPDVNFKYPVFHPNINCNSFDVNKPEGKYHICIENLNNWNPEYNMVSVILSIYNLLANPNPGNGYSNDATKLLNEGKKEEFKSKCNEWVRKYSTIYNK